MANTNTAAAAEILTPDQRRRTVESLGETIQAKNKAESYPWHLRDVALIAFYDKHVAKLQAMLETGQWEAGR
jgi:hypothetical protein